jgi:hypothetical protein
VSDDSKIVIIDSELNFDITINVIRFLFIDNGRGSRFVKSRRYWFTKQSKNDTFKEGGFAESVRCVYETYSIIGEMKNIILSVRQQPVEYQRFYFEGVLFCGK